MPDFDADGYIYFLFYRGELVYIGQSVSLHGRIGNHTLTKMFDQIKYEECPIEKLRSREKELIKHYQPILNDVGNKNPKIKLKVIGDYVFIHEGKLCLNIRDGKLYNKSDKRVGEINADFIKWEYYDIINTYNFSDESISWVYKEYKPKSEPPKLSRWETDRRNLDIMNAEIKNSEVRKMPECGTLSDNLKFKFGKYKGELVKDVRKTNPSYIDWFERVVLNNEVQK